MRHEPVYKDKAAFVDALERASFNLLFNQATAGEDLAMGHAIEAVFGEDFHHMASPQRRWHNELEEAVKYFSAAHDVTPLKAIFHVERAWAAYNAVYGFANGD